MKFEPGNILCTTGIREIMRTYENRTDIVTDYLPGYLDGIGETSTARTSS